MTRQMLNEIARKMGIDIKQYDKINAHFDANSKWLLVEMWKDQGIGSQRGKHDVHSIKIQYMSLYKKWQSGGADPDDWETGGDRRIFDIR